MKAGNVNYINTTDLPETLAILPLESVLILPGGYLPINVFEPRYIGLVNDAMIGNRLIGVIQILPNQRNATLPKLYQVGCLARIVSFNETGDGRLFITLQGVCRFRCDHELYTANPYRTFAITPRFEDLKATTDDGGTKCRERLLDAFSNYLDINNLEIDWKNVTWASSEALVNALSISAPFSAAEKQALLEATTLKNRAEILIALTERAILSQGGIEANDLQ